MASSRDIHGSEWALERERELLKGALSIIRTVLGFMRVDYIVKPQEKVGDNFQSPISTA